MKRILYLTIKEVEFSAYKLAVLLLTGNESIPPFSTRYPDVLERCIYSPQQTFDKKDMYPTLHKKAAILFYLLIKDHPFKNGNKRIALTSLILFLEKNGYTITIDTIRLYRFTLWIAESDASLKNSVLDTVEELIKKYSTTL